MLDCDRIHAPKGRHKGALTGADCHRGREVVNLVRLGLESRDRNSMMLPR
jgi:hypothetical protein